MREIKFRAWYKNVRRGKRVGDDIVWSRVSYYDYDPIIDNKGLCDVEAGWDIQGHENKNDYILEQYTGLKDKNGKEIYEGDIVEYVTHYYGNENRHRKVVEWGEWYSDDFGEPHNLGYFNLSEVMEVIGNIHENPELLGDKK